MKKVNRYAIRYYMGNQFSKIVGFKAKLVDYKKALKIVKRLKRSGVDAFADKMIINVADNFKG